MPETSNILKRNKEGFYLINGEPHVSVTTVLSSIRKPALEFWRGSVGNSKANKIQAISLRVGTAVHKHIQDFFETGSEAIKGRQPKQVGTAVQSFNMWWKNHVVDLEELVFYDFKTSGYLDENYWLQLHAYASAFGHMWKTQALNPELHGFKSEIVLYNSVFRYAGTADLIYVPDKIIDGTRVSLQIIQLAKDGKPEFKVHRMYLNTNFVKSFLSLVVAYRDLQVVKETVKNGVEKSGVV